jgi:hypothetical protein
VCLDHLRQALACAGLEMVQTSESVIIRVSDAYKYWGWTSIHTVPAIIRFQGIHHE